MYNMISHNKETYKQYFMYSMKSTYKPGYVYTYYACVYIHGYTSIDMDTQLIKVVTSEDSIKN